MNELGASVLRVLSVEPSSNADLWWSRVLVNGEEVNYLAGAAKSNLCYFPDEITVMPFNHPLTRVDPPENCGHHAPRREVPVDFTHRGNSSSFTKGYKRATTFHTSYRTVLKASPSATLDATRH